MVKVVKMKETHIEQIKNNFIEQQWGSREEVLKQYYLEQEAGERVVLVAENDKDCLGYITLVIRPIESLINNIPEIKDLNVFIKFQNSGVGTLLLNEIIKLASNHCFKVGIGVGLNSNYGPAQRMYVKAGFIPDGKGIYYKGQPIKVNELCKNDDDLALYFTKKLS